MRAFGVGLALILMAQVAAAQEARPLTLEQARALAAEHNPAYARAANAVVRAQAGEALSRAAILPTLGLSFGSSGSLSRTFTGTDPYGQQIRRDEPLKYTASNSNQGVSLNMTLFDGGRRFRDVRAAQAGERAAVAGVESAASTMEAEVTRRYYAAKQTFELIRLEEALLRGAEARHAATERLIRVAAASPLDLMGTEIEVARQRQAVETAKGEARKAMLLLAEQIGTGEVDGWVLVTELPEVFDPTTIEAERLVTRARDVSPVLRQFQATAEQAEHQRRAAGAARWPTVSAGTGFSRSIGSSGYDALFEPNPLNQGLSFNLQVSLPLLQQYQTTQNVTQARMNALDAQASARETTLRLEREVRSALIDLESAYRIAQVSEATAELNRRRLELANERYRLGSLTFAEMQTIIETAATAERDALNARYAFAAALATLQEQVGGSLE